MNLIHCGSDGPNEPPRRGDVGGSKALVEEAGEETRAGVIYTCIVLQCSRGSSVILRKHTRVPSGHRARLVCAIIELLKKKKNMYSADL